MADQIAISFQSSGVKSTMKVVSRNPGNPPKTAPMFPQVMEWIPSQMILILDNLSSSSHPHEAQEERSRLSGTACGDIKVTICIGLFIGS